jgi:hypothetical protein
LPYGDPQISNNPRYEFSVAGPNGTYYTFSGGIETPRSPEGHQDPVVQDGAFQTFVNLLDGLTNYSVQTASKIADTTIYCTPDEA